MRYMRRHIGRLLSGKFFVKDLQLLTIFVSFLLLSACASEPTEVIEEPKEKPVLKVYLFAPDNPIVTRADIGDVNPLLAESEIKTLDIWVFEHVSQTLVGYIHLSNQIFDSNDQKVVTMDITDDYAEKNPKPSVDIYVVANATALNSGLAFNRDTTPSELEAAKIGRSTAGDFFGLTALVDEVPDDGLPMSGLLKEQTVDDSTAPVYSVAMTKKVKLVRAVSKVRFILSQSTTNPPAVSDLSIKFDDNMIPTNEYIFLSGEYPTVLGHIDNTSYESGEEYNKVLASGIGSGDINGCENPASYVYRSQGNEDETAQEYETRIDDGVNANYLSQIGRYYLRESDKKITGTITYNVGGDNRTVPFEMAAAGDFTRNHTWIVYGYFLGKGDLVLNAVYTQPWEDNPESDKVYNW